MIVNGLLKLAADVSELFSKGYVLFHLVLAVCYLKTLESIMYSVISDYIDDQPTVDVGEAVTFGCIGKRYPNVGDQWWLSRTVECIASATWEIILQCKGIHSIVWYSARHSHSANRISLNFSAACDKPILQNGQFEPPPLVNNIKRTDAGLTAISFCNYHFKLSTGVDKQNLTCQESNSEWTPNITCQRK